MANHHHPGAGHGRDEISARESTEPRQVSPHTGRPSHPPCPPWLDPVKELFLGFDFFKREIYQKNREFFAQLATGQKPKYMILACSDSRVCPSHVMHLNLGEAFMFRNVANMVPEYSDQPAYGGLGAAIEYAVHLKVQSIVVVGHSRCGGIQALMEGESSEFEFVGDWVKIGQHARDFVKSHYGHLPFEEQCVKCEVKSVNNSLKNLLTYPFVAEAVGSNALALYGGHYDFVEGPSLKIWPAGHEEPSPSAE